MSLFSPARLAAILAETIPPDLPPTITHLVVGTVDQAGAQVVVSVTRQHGRQSWELQAAAKHTWSGDDEVRGTVILKW